MSTYAQPTPKYKRPTDTLKYMLRANEFVGNVFTYLTVLEVLLPKNGKSRVKCICKCGKIIESNLACLKNGSTKSCGCYTRSVIGINRKTHGDSYSGGLYRVWSGLKGRCYNKNNQDYKDYGGRGITVCKEWENDYPTFKKWALANGYKKGLQIDRTENNDIYRPSNCRFVTNLVNANNKRSNRYIEFNGERKRPAEWEVVSGIPKQLIIARLNALKWSPEKTLTTPVRKGKYNINKQTYQYGKL